MQRDVPKTALGCKGILLFPRGGKGGVGAFSLIDVVHAAALKQGLSPRVASEALYAF